METNEKLLLLPNTHKCRTEKIKSKLILFSWVCIFLLSTLTTNFTYGQPANVSLSFAPSVGTTAPCTFILELADTTILAIELGLGSSSNQSDLFAHEFAFDVFTGLPTGLTYSRVGNKVYIGIGEQPLLDYYFGQARIKEGSSQWSEVYNFIQN